MTYTTPIRDLYYGLPLYYRAEHRTSGDVLIVSYRPETEGKVKILHEMPPIGGKEISHALQTFQHVFTDNAGFLMSLPVELQIRMCHNWIGLSTPERCKRRKGTPGLTFGILLTADRQELLCPNGTERKSDTIEDDKRILTKLIAQFGNIPWQEVTPQFCAPWLGKQSEHTKKACKRLMLNFERLQLRAGVLDELMWENYFPENIRRQRKSPKTAVRNQLEPFKLTDGQCTAIFRNIRDRLNSGNADGIDLAILLILSTTLDLPYISALLLSDFCFLAEFKTRLSVRIERKMIKAKTNYICKQIDDPYERRVVPLPSLAGELYETLVKKATSLNRPMVANPNNKNRHLTPERLKAEIARRLISVQLIRTTDLAGIKLPSVFDTLVPTGLQELKKVGLEEEELRALQGKRPQLVSAKHYYDRRNESALNKIGSLQDRWIHRVCPATSYTRSTKDRLKKKDDSLSWISPNPGQRTQLWITLHIPAIPRQKIPPDGITFELCALHGLSGTITKERDYGGKK